MSDHAVIDLRECDGVRGSCVCLWGGVGLGRSRKGSEDCSVV